MDNRGFRSLYFILFILLAMYATTIVAPEHVQNLTQKVVFTVGMVVLIAGSVWRIVQRTRKVSQKKSLTVQAVGTGIAVLTALSGMIW